MFYALIVAILIAGGSSDNGGTSDPGLSGSGSTTTSATSTHSKPNVAAIVGALIGALAIGVLATICFCLLRRRRQHAAPVADEPPRPRRIRGNYVIQPFATTAELDTEPASAESSPEKTCTCHCLSFVHSTERVGRIQGTSCGTTRARLPSLFSQRKRLSHHREAQARTLPAWTRFRAQLRGNAYWKLALRCLRRRLLGHHLRLIFPSKVGGHIYRAPCLTCRLFE
jgi:hypothetical protein